MHRNPIAMKLPSVVGVVLGVYKFLLPKTKATLGSLKLPKAPAADLGPMEKPIIPEVVVLVWGVEADVVRC
jgi:hypothetical protein